MEFYFFCRPTAKWSEMESFQLAGGILDVLKLSSTSISRCQIGISVRAWLTRIRLYPSTEWRLVSNNFYIFEALESNIKVLLKFCILCRLMDSVWSLTATFWVHLLNTCLVSCPRLRKIVDSNYACQKFGRHLIGLLQFTWLVQEIR